LILGHGETEKFKKYDNYNLVIIGGDEQGTMGINPSKPGANQTNKDLADFSESDDGRKKVVVQKLQSLYGEKLQGEALEKFATILSDKERLKEIYLHTDFEKAKELQRSIKDLKLQKPTVLQRATMKYSSQASASPIPGSELSIASTPPSKSRRSRSGSAMSGLGDSAVNISVSPVTSVNTSGANLVEEVDEEYEEDETSDMTTDSNVPIQNPYSELDSNKIRIKLIVAETSKNALEKNIKRMISPFVD